MNNALPILSSDALTMSSLEISQLVESRHDSVRRTIERCAEKGVFQLPPLVEVEDKQSLSPNNKTKTYNLVKRDSFVVVAQLSPEFTARLVDRWQELEGRLEPKPVIGLHPMHQAAVVSASFVGMAEAFGFSGNQAKLSADKAVKAMTGVSPLQIMGHTHLISEHKEALLTPSDIAKQLKMKTREINPLLGVMGLQTSRRDHKNRLVYEVTELGAELSEALDTGKKHGDGTPVKQLKWRSSICNLILAHLKEQGEDQKA